MNSDRLPLTMPLTPHQNDVLLGRGCTITNHPGNLQFRNIVQEKKPLYAKATKKKEKRALALEIVERIENMNPPGRFLVEAGEESKSSASAENKGDNWVCVDKEKAIVKVLHRLREKEKGSGGISRQIMSSSAVAASAKSISAMKSDSDFVNSNSASTAANCSAIDAVGFDNANEVANSASSNAFAAATPLEQFYRSAGLGVESGGSRPSPSCTLSNNLMDSDANNMSLDQLSRLFGGSGQGINRQLNGGNLIDISGGDSLKTPMSKNDSSTEVSAARSLLEFSSHDLKHENANRGSDNPKIDLESTSSGRSQLPLPTLANLLDQQSHGQHDGADAFKIQTTPLEQLLHGQKNSEPEEKNPSQSWQSRTSFSSLLDPRQPNRGGGSCEAESRKAELQNGGDSTVNWNGPIGLSGSGILQNNSMSSLCLNNNGVPSMQAADTGERENESFANGFQSAHAQQQQELHQKLVTQLSHLQPTPKLSLFTVLKAHGSQEQSLPRRENDDFTAKSTGFSQDDTSVGFESSNAYADNPHSKTCVDAGICTNSLESQINRLSSQKPSSLTMTNKRHLNARISALNGNCISMNLHDWIEVATELIPEQLAKEVAPPFGLSPKYLKTYLPMALEVSRKLVETLITTLNHGHTPDFGSPFQAQPKMNFDFNMDVFNTRAISLDVTTMSSDALAGSESFFSNGHIVNSVRISVKGEPTIANAKRDESDSNVFQGLFFIFYELFTLGRSPFSDSSKKGTGAAKSSVNDAMVKAKRSLLGNQFEDIFTGFLHSDPPSGRDSVAARNTKNSVDKRKKTEDQTHFSVLQSYGIPSSLCRLIDDLKNSHESSSGKGRLSCNKDVPQSSTFCSLEDLLSDLNDISSDPDHLLYDSEGHNDLSAPTLFFAKQEKELALLISTAQRIHPNLSAQNSSVPFPDVRPNNKRSRCEVVWITGQSGVGKTSLVKNFEEYLHLCRQGRLRLGNGNRQDQGSIECGMEVLEVKFDLMKKSKPLETISSAFDNYFVNLIQQTENSIDGSGFKKAILKQKVLSDFLTNIVENVGVSVGKSGISTICEMIPTFRQIYSVYGISSSSEGKFDVGNPSASNLSLSDCTTHNDIASSFSIGKMAGVATTERNRLNDIFRKFLRALSSCAKSPFLIVLDDCQFADQPSLELLRSLTQEFPTESASSNCSGLMIVGCFQVDEVDHSHPLTLFRRGLECDGVAAITDIHLVCLDDSTVESMISKALSLPTRVVRPLGRLLLAKTSGVPHFLKAYFDSLLKDNLINFSLIEKRWVWEYSNIENKPIADNVARYFARKLKSLPQNLKTELKIMSCFGSSIGGEALTFLSSEGSEDLLTSLDQAVRQGFLVKNGEDFKFSHEIIQQEAYMMIPSELRSKFHKVLATKLINKTPTMGERDSSGIFLVVDQINRIELQTITNVAERKLYSQINLKAAQKAIGMFNFKSALKYVECGLSLLENGHWNSNYTLTLQLYNVASHASYVDGRQDDMHKYLKEVFGSAKCFEDKLEAYFVLILSLSASGELNQAYQCCLNILAQLEEVFPSKIDDHMIRFSIEKTMTSLKDLDKGHFDLLPVMIDKSKLIVMRLLKQTFQLAYQIGLKTGILLACRMTDLTLNHGLCKESAWGIVAFGRYAMSISVHEGYRIGKLAMSMKDNPVAVGEQGSVSYFFYSMIASLVEPLQASTEPLFQAYDDIMKTGDINIAASAALEYCKARNYSGVEMGLVSKDYTCFITELLRQKQLHVVRLLLNEHYRIVEMLELPEDPLAPILSDEFTQEKLFEYAVEKDNKSLLSCIFMSQLRQSLVFGDMQRVENLIDGIEKYEAKRSDFIEDPRASFLLGLCMFRLAKKTGDMKWYQLGRKHIGVVQQWSLISQWNWEGKLRLLEAECHYVDKQYNQAATLYEASSKLARKNKLIQEEALVLELWALMCQEIGKVDLYRAKMKEARRCYLERGNKAKARHVAAYL